MNWLFWAPLAAASLHIIEEFVYPGHFSEWYQRYKPGIRKSITGHFLIIINILLLILCYDVGAMSPSPIRVAAWLGVMSLLAANGVWHVRGAIKTRSYSPGILTGTLVYLPLTVYGYVFFLNSKQASILTALIAFAVGASYQLWSNLFHRLRAKATAS
jgi:uncharacterized membrane protein HdeD (DUF308 family)